MTWYLLFFKRWYELRVIREKLFLLALCCSLWYGIFSLFVFWQINNQKAALRNDIKVLTDQTESWKIQIATLNKISGSPLYKQWVLQRQLFKNLQGQSKSLLWASSTNQWQEVTKAVLRSYQNITLVQIKNFPESLFNSVNITGTTTNIYQQKLLMIVYGNFFDILAYLQALEKLLPNVHWDSLNYQVVQYPIAKAEMEFSIFYEKNS